MASESSEGQSTKQVVARYANYFEIGHNAAEFFVDFGQAYSQSEEYQVHTRIVTSPLYARALQRLLAKAITLHEQAYGEIREDLSDHKD